MIREEKFNLLNELLRYEENNDIGNLTRAERREFQQWISKALEQKSVIDKIEEEINSPNRGTCDYFVVDRIEEIINDYKTESEGEE